MCDPDREPARPSLRSVISNWREYDAPFTTKLRLALRNYWIRARHLQNCCGNAGEPGC